MQAKRAGIQRPACGLRERSGSLEFAFDPVVVGAGLVPGGVLVGLSGTLATYSVVRQPPAGVLAQAS